MFSAGVLTISDKGSRGEREDRSGKIITGMLPRLSCESDHYAVVPDEKEAIANTLIEWGEHDRLDLILTTGGTGLGPRDVTPEATMSVIERTVPGIAEAMRMQTFGKAPTSILSRAVAGVRGKCLIINLPGNPQAVRECLEVIAPVIPHAIEIIKGIYTEHPGSSSSAH